MFNPTQHDVRRFFCETYRKTLAREILTPLEVIASDWIVQHPEFEKDLSDVNKALVAEYPVDQGKTNPFLHLAMHLSIAEQISINQPAGITPAYAQLAQRLQSAHEAHHHVMECLGAMMWESQRNGTPFDADSYIEAVKAGARRK
jgi:hypothetical protein